GQARECARPDRLADRCDDVADPVMLELLRRRALLVNIVALALTECLIHLTARNIDGRQLVVAHLALVTRVLEHRERLTAVIDEHARAAKLRPRERGIGSARRDEEAIHLVDLRKVHRRWGLAFLQRPKRL